MKLFNYGEFSRVFSIAMGTRYKTKLTKTLFKPIIEQEDVLNRFGEPVNIDSTTAKRWCDNSEDVPQNIKIAAGRDVIAECIGDYFSTYVLGVITNDAKQDEMILAMLELVSNSSLDSTRVNELRALYDDCEYPDFLGKAFLYSLLENNHCDTPVIQSKPIEDDLQKFTDLIREKYQKPISLQPPKRIDSDEMVYVKELFEVYQEYSGEKITKPKDLDANPKLRNHFDRQRKDYYKAETIHRALRDTVCLDEKDYFEPLKDEMYDGVIDTRDQDYENGYSRLNSVMSQAVNVPLSNNMRNITLDWVGAGEKKGLCHMLVSDNRMKWVDDDEKKGKK